AGIHYPMRRGEISGINVFIGSHRTLDEQQGSQKKKKILLGLHGNTAADSVQSGWPFVASQPKAKHSLARRRIKVKAELKL
ncbi:hypothetical protein TNCV_106681, partial [Trichonephila clavipes]